MSKDPLQRKLKYVEKFASIEGVELSMLKLEAQDALARLSLSLNVATRFFLDMFLNLTVQLDWSLFEYHKIDFRTLLMPEFPAPPHHSNPGNPVSDGDLERYAFHLRKMVMDKDTATYKAVGQSLLKRIQQLRQVMLDRGVDPLTLDLIERSLAIVEGKMANIGYVGFAVVGAFKVASAYSPLSHFPARIPGNWKDTITCETSQPYESHVGFTRVGYMRVGSVKVGGSVSYAKELSDHLVKTVNEFWRRAGFSEQYGEKVFYPRVFLKQRVPELHWHGGEHQMRIQEVINRVKPILNRLGVMAQMRCGYLAYAQEFYYHQYEGGRKWKHLKTILTDEELITKYKTFGAEESILREIEKVLKPWLKTIPQ